MKVIESQAAVLSNYEVFQHLSEQRESYKKAKRRGPPNLETLIKQVLKYMRTNPNPLSQDPNPYSPECIAALLERLRPYELSKGEMIMILNLRPVSVPALSTVIEEIVERYTTDQQDEMVEIIAEVLGQFDPPPAADEEDNEGGEAADVSMGDTPGV